MENIGEVLKRTTDTKAARIGIGAIESSHEVFNELFPGRKAILVADTNTTKLQEKESRRTWKRTASQLRVNLCSMIRIFMQNGGI